MAAFPSALAGVGLRKTLLVLRAVGRPGRSWQAALLVGAEAEGCLWAPRGASRAGLARLAQPF